MHDLDRTLLEYESDFEEDYYEGEDEYGLEPEYGTDYEFDDTEGEVSDPFGEEEEMDLAAELLSVESEAELDMFMGKLFKKVKKWSKKSPIGRALVKGLKKVAKKALPIAGGALGGYFGGPLGAKIGSSLASRAGQMFGLELEGLSADDAQFEIARRYVRLAGAAINKAAKASPNMPPLKAAHNALASAARIHAPGLIKGGGGSSPGLYGYGKSGRWTRRGRRIIVYGV